MLLEITTYLFALIQWAHYMHCIAGMLRIFFIYSNNDDVLGETFKMNCGFEQLDVDLQMLFST